VGASFDRLLQKKVPVNRLPTRRRTIGPATMTVSMAPEAIFEQRAARVNHAVLESARAIGSAARSWRSCRFSSRVWVGGGFCAAFDRTIPT